MKIVTIDFETFAIHSRPDYPPDPVGVAIKKGDAPSTYYAWGHPTDNNCTKQEACAELEELWHDESVDLLFHNAKFDIAVAHERLGLPIPPWQRIHDTMFLLFLVDPHARTMALKPAAEKWLRLKPEEQENLNEWLWNHRHLIEDEERRVGAMGAGEKITKRNLGAYIAYGPGNLVGSYARGDVDRTWLLFKELYEIVGEEGMLQAYARERRLLPVLLENERDGVHVNLDLLRKDVEKYGAVFTRVEDGLRHRLNAHGLNFDADADVVNILSRERLVDNGKWTLTKTGRKSVAKDALTPDMFNDPEVASALGYRNRLKTCLTMFMEPWLRQAEARGGVISTNWNQVRGDGGGTRTGRPSTSDPNFLNISKSFEGRPDGYIHPDFLGVPKLPLVRKYILPDPDHTFLHRDFDGQELRVFAHLEQGDLMAAYREDAATDPHAFVGQRIAPLAFGRPYDKDRDRDLTKILNFQALYGGGVPAAAKKLRCSLAKAKEFKAFHDQALPGRKIVNDEIKRVVRQGAPIVTLGGRKYYPEEPKIVDGRLQTWEYKLINYYVQGSAADITKEVLCNWHDHPDRNARFLAAVYDEINISAHREVADKQMQVLKEVMEDVKLDVPMRSSGKRGPSWGELEKEPS